MSIDWDAYPNFSKKEFDCQHTGKNRMDPDFLHVLQQVRTVYNKPMAISSGYRAPDHPIELAKKKAGEHSYGVAADILVRGEDAMELIVIAYGHGIRRIGVNQKGNSRFIHLGYGDKLLGFPTAIWSY